MQPLRAELYLQVAAPNVQHECNPSLIHPPRRQTAGRRFHPYPACRSAPRLVQQCIPGKHPLGNDSAPFQCAIPPLPIVPQDAHSGSDCPRQLIAMVQIALERLARRHMSASGLTRAQADTRIALNDALNAEIVSHSRPFAKFLLRE